MMRYLAGRLLRALLTIFLVVTFAFFVLRLSGDPALLIMSVDAPPEFDRSLPQIVGSRPADLDAIPRLYRPCFDRRSRQFDARRPAAIQLVLERVPATLVITVPAFFLKIAIGVPAGIYAALHRNSFADRLTMLLSVAGFTMPSFVLALLLVLVFSVQLGWLPSSGSEGMANAILPIVTLGAAGAAILARFTRSAMLEVLGQPYIRAASAKGLSWRRVVTEHALPNAAIPTTTIIGFMVGTLIAGAVVVESVFAWPGIGRLLVVSVANRDLAVVQTILLLVAATMVTANIIVDFVYGWIDPRMRTAPR